jgi:hypothetical protein
MQEQKSGSRRAFETPTGKVMPTQSGGSAALCDGSFAGLKKSLWGEI